MQKILFLHLLFYHLPKQRTIPCQENFHRNQESKILHLDQIHEQKQFSSYALAPSMGAVHKRSEVGRQSCHSLPVSATYRMLRHNRDLPKAYHQIQGIPILPRQVQPRFCPHIPETVPGSYVSQTVRNKRAPVLSLFFGLFRFLIFFYMIYVPLQNTFFLHAPPFPGGFLLLLEIPPSPAPLHSFHR